MKWNLLQIGCAIAVLSLAGCNRGPAQAASGTSTPAATPATAPSSPAAPAAAAMGAPEGGVASGKLIQVHIDSTPNANYRCDGNNPFQLEGSSNAVRITGHCRMLQVEGSSNAITIDQVDSVQIQGDSNLVTWLSGSKPSFASEGSSNSVQRGAGGGSGAMASNGIMSNGATVMTGSDPGDVNVQGRSGETVRKHNGRTVVRGSSGAGVQVNPDGSTTIQSSSGKVIHVPSQPQ